MEKNNSKPMKVVKDLTPMAICQGAVVVLIILGALLLDALGVYEFSHTVITGAILGGIVTLANYAFLTISVDREIAKFMAKRGEREMSEEEAEKFAAENSMPVQNAIKTSFIIRMASMTATLVVAFITDFFNPLATAIPLLAFRPLLTACELFRAKNNKPADPSKFIKYDNNEKEDI